MGLREKTIELIQKEGQFDMAVFKPWGDSPCGTACCIAGNICLAAGLDLKNISYNHVSETARLVWAKNYGKEDAARLQFDESGWGDELHEVTAEEAIAHINGAPPVVHGHLWDEEEDYS